MKINGNAIRPGNVIEHKGALWRAVKTQHVKPGKGGAFLQVELKRLKDGTKLNERFRANETVERAFLEQREHQFLFADGDSYTFMDQETFDQVSLNTEDIGEGTAFLQDGMTVILETHEGTPIGISLPDHVTLEVIETEPVVKNQTATSSYKPAVLENGVKTTVPQFVNVGDRIIVATTDSTYTKRAD
ncbi:MAG: elongation factor P, partial [Alphaproteobacteria bacterium]